MYNFIFLVMVAILERFSMGSQVFEEKCLKSLQGKQDESQELTWLFGSGKLKKNKIQ